MEDLRLFCFSNCSHSLGKFISSPSKVLMGGGCPSCWFRLPSVSSWERAWGSAAVLCRAAGWALPSVRLQCMGFVRLVLGRANCKGLRWAGFAASCHRPLFVDTKDTGQRTQDFVDTGLPSEALRRQRALGFVCPHLNLRAGVQGVRLGTPLAHGVCSQQSLEQLFSLDVFPRSRVSTCLP